jgi:hypothetical protein
MYSRPYYQQQQQPRDVITSNGSQSARSTINDRVCSPDRPTINRPTDHQPTKRCRDHTTSILPLRLYVLVPEEESYTEQYQ